jgi:RNA polymerase sigma-70 factor (ECF subfamily)
VQSPDDELLKRIASGDSPAFAAFYDRHAPRVLGLLRHMLGSEQAEDVLQETFLQVWSRAWQYDPARAPVLAWVSLIARSRALDHLKRHRREGALGPGQEPACWQDPCSLLERLEAGHRLRQALEQLPDNQRSAITLASLGGLTHDEVARTQGLPLGTVKTRIRLGMKRLRELLAE